MPYFDSHCHFDPAAPAAAEPLLAAAAEAGVTRLAAIAGDPAMNGCVLDLARKHPERVVCALGFDRDQAELADGKLDFGRLREQAEDPACRALGEIGLDYHYAPETAHRQRALFEKMLALALDLRRPVVVHSREADADTLLLLLDFVAAWRRDLILSARPPAVLHCYTGGPAFADALLELGLVISFSGILTFRNAAPLRELAARLPLDRLLIETDSPYLAPIPYRGTPNQPAYVVRVAETLADLRPEPLSAIADATFANAAAFFAPSR